VEENPKSERQGTAKLSSDSQAAYCAIDLHSHSLRHEGSSRLVLTMNGKAEVVVQDAEAYQELLDRVQAIEGLHRGLSDVKAGRTKPAREVFNRLRRKHGISR
jgi:hypothetical protein